MLSLFELYKIKKVRDITTILHKITSNKNGKFEKGLSMRKKVKDEYLYIKKFWNIFIWEQCEICKYEFRRESGWKILEESDTISFFDSYRKVCCNCIPEIEDVKDFIDNTNNINTNRYNT